MKYDEFINQIVDTAKERCASALVSFKTTASGRGIGEVARSESHAYSNMSLDFSGMKAKFISKHDVDVPDSIVEECRVKLGSKMDSLIKKAGGVVASALPQVSTNVAWCREIEELPREFIPYVNTVLNKAISESIAYNEKHILETKINVLEEQVVSLKEDLKVVKAWLNRHIPRDTFDPDSEVKVGIPRLR
jgi:hypothetical protein